MTRAAADLIIFDCDGVLVDSEMIACEVDAEYLGEIGIAITADEILERYVGRSADSMRKDLEVRHGRALPADFLATLQARVLAAFETRLRPVAGVDEALRALTSRRCVASSSAPVRLRRSLTLTGLIGHFDPHIFSATQVKNGKPAPDLFLFAAKQMGTAPANCIVIEDSVAGVTAAGAAGMRAVGFTGGSHCRPGDKDRLVAAGAASVFDDLGGALRWSGA